VKFSKFILTVAVLWAFLAVMAWMSTPLAISFLAGDGPKPMVTALVEKTNNHRGAVLLAPFVLALAFGQLKRVRERRNAAVNREHHALAHRISSIAEGCDRLEKHVESLVSDEDRHLVEKMKETLDGCRSHLYRLEREFPARQVHLREVLVDIASQRRELSDRVTVYRNNDEVAQLVEKEKQAMRTFERHYNQVFGEYGSYREEAETVREMEEKLAKMRRKISDYRLLKQQKAETQTELAKMKAELDKLQA
jgi:hypothetical protein